MFAVNPKPESLGRSTRAPGQPRVIFQQSLEAPWSANHSAGSFIPLDGCVGQILLQLVSFPEPPVFNRSIS